jgi:hypothetical protein
VLCHATRRTASLCGCVADVFRLPVVSNRTRSRICGLQTIATSAPMPSQDEERHRRIWIVFISHHRTCFQSKAAQGACHLSQVLVLSVSITHPDSRAGNFDHFKRQYFSRATGNTVGRVRVQSFTLDGNGPVRRNSVRPLRPDVFTQ